MRYRPRNPLQPNTVAVIPLICMMNYCSEILPDYRVLAGHLCPPTDERPPAPALTPLFKSVMPAVSWSVAKPLHCSFVPEAYRLIQVRCGGLKAVVKSDVRCMDC